MKAMTAQRWSDMSPRQQTALRVSTAVQFALAAGAWIDLARRPAAAVNGSKAVWALVIGINYVGPIAYFARGRGPRT